MQKEYLIKKWLDNELTLEEEIAFKASDDYSFLINVTHDLKDVKLKATFNEELEFSKLKGKIELKKNKKKKVISLKFMSKVAAIFVLSLCSFFYFTSKKNITTLRGETTVFELPDKSRATVDALSSIKLKRFNWNRNITLDGEAFFEVEKGKKFTVTTNAGAVEVLGTKFNVIARDNYFETTCYEGRVLVTYKESKKILNAGDQFLVIDHKIITTKNTKKTLKEWSSNKSIFKSTPIKYVFKEFERHYKTKIKGTFNTNEIFTGSFVHDDKNLALKSITLALNLKVKQYNNTIILSKK